MARILFHIDLNAFFASAEELRHPELKDKPLAIGSKSARGVLSTCNYIARDFGVHSAMPTSQAMQLCPELVVLESDHEYYRKLSNQFFAYLRQYSGALEVLSVDECFLDVTDVIKRYPRPLDLAVQIQRGVLDELGLKCSIGVAPTRFLAKMASDLRKPMGISVLRKRDIPSKLYPLPIEACYGIGQKTVPKLKEQGINTIGDLADEANEAKCKQILQNSWIELQQKITGNSSAELIFSTTRKSVSHSRTFPSDLYTIDEVLEQCAKMTREVAAGMQKKKMKGSSVSLTLRDGNFCNRVHSARLPEMTNDPFILLEAVRSLVYRYFEPVGYRLLGISVGSLQDEDKIILQPTIFEAAKTTSNDVIHSLNRQLEGAGLTTLGSLMKKQEENQKSETKSGNKETAPSDSTGKKRGSKPAREKAA